MEDYEKLRRDIKMYFDSLPTEKRPKADLRSPLELAYIGNEPGKFDFDHKIREDLSTLVGFKIDCDAKIGDGELAFCAKVVFFFKNITKEMLESKCDPEHATIGDLNEIAKTIHPEAEILKNNLAGIMWDNIDHYRFLKFLLGLRGFEINDIETLSFCDKRVDYPNSAIIKKNDTFHYAKNLDDGWSCNIRDALPVWCFAAFLW